MKFKFSQKYFLPFLVAILFVAILIRFYKLAAIPHGMTWDEAAIGYNGYAIFHTRRDEWLHHLPVSFMSFGDYKAPLAIYLNGLFTAIFGMNLWAVRLPFTVASILAIWGFMLLLKKLTDDNFLSIMGAILLTLSPWHIHYSRAGFESGIALTFFIWSLYFLLTYLDSKKPKLITLLFSATTAAAALYTYHSAKVVLPLTFLSILLIYHQQVKNKIQDIFWAGSLALLYFIPLIWDSFWGQGLTRLGTTVLNDLSGFQLLKTILGHFLRHLSLNFLLHGETTTLRHGDGSWGVLLGTTFLLVILGVIWGVVTLMKQKKVNKIFTIGVMVIIYGLLPAALGEEVPHSNRALLALPGFLMLAVWGAKKTLSWVQNSQLNKTIKGSHGEKNIITTAVLGTFFLVHLLLFTAYFSNYLTVFAAQSAADFKDGYLAAFSYVVPYENKVDKILFTDEYGQPYIYALFVKKTNPIWYQGGELIKYEFTDNINPGDLSRQNTIVVSGQDGKLDPKLADKIIYGSNGKIRFKIYLPKEK